MPKVRRFGNYLLHDMLAVGGMGELYLATRVGAAKGTPPSVLKILLPEYSQDADFVSMFHDEARIGMQLQHPNVVSVQDLGRVDGTPYLVMEYVHGENLRNIADRLAEMGEAFPPDLAVRIAIEILNGLDYAHGAKDAAGRPMNLVHRDLSPDNVIVSFDGDVKVLDFGIAKADGRATQTQLGILKGKTQYMSPEQALGQNVDARSDLHAVGLLLLEIITGKRRFPAELDPIQQIRDARVWKPVPPSRGDPSLPVELDVIIAKSTEVDPKRRFQTADEFASALNRLRRERMKGSSENVLRLLRRLFPDREEPFLQFDEEKAPAAEKRPARAPSPPATKKLDSAPEIGFDDASDLPSESEILGAFLGGKGSGPKSAPRAPAPPPPPAPARAPAPAPPPRPPPAVEDRTQVAIRSPADEERPRSRGRAAPEEEDATSDMSLPADTTTESEDLDERTAFAAPALPARPPPPAAKRERDRDSGKAAESAPSAENLPGDFDGDGTRVGAMPPIQKKKSSPREAPARDLARAPRKKSGFAGRAVLAFLFVLVFGTALTAVLLRSGWLPPGIQARFEPVLATLPMLRPPPTPGTPATPTARPTETAVAQATASEPPASPVPSATPELAGDDDDEPAPTGRVLSGGGVFPGGGDDDDDAPAPSPTPRRSTR